MSKFAYANFDGNFYEFKGFALKNPIRGVAPEPHELFEKSSTKTFEAHFVRKSLFNFWL
ncbi:MAG: hypothetical protein IJU14_00830 [Clostridia bacterium]|nr:hypothetical protein [Clostridia bacterium]